MKFQEYFLVLKDLSFDFVSFRLGITVILGFKDRKGSTFKVRG